MHGHNLHALKILRDQLSRLPANLLWTISPPCNAQLELGHDRRPAIARVLGGGAGSCKKKAGRNLEVWQDAFLSTQHTFCHSFLEALFLEQ